MIKGLFVINSLSGGGAEKVFAKLVDLLDKDTEKNYQFDVVILDRQKELYQLPSSVVVHRLENSWGILGQIFRFIILVRKIKPDFVLSFLFRSNWYNVIGSKLFGYKSILSERGNTNARLTGSYVKLKKALIKSVFNSGDLTICVSTGVGQCLVDEYSLNPSKMVVLNNFYNLLEIDKASKEISIEDSGYILAIGRLVKIKGFDGLIEAYAKSGLNRELWILGDGPELSKLQTLAEQLGVGNKVRFLGFIKNPYPYMRRAYCFTLTSHFEGFPNAMIESMSLGVPSMATLTDGPIDILQPKGSVNFGSYQLAEYGIVFNSRDTQAISQALVDLHTDKDLYQALSLAAAERAKFYTVEKFYSCFNGILQEKVLSSKHV